MNDKKVPISLSKNDYVFLNYVQQGILFSGAAISNVFDFSDILKACVLHSALKIFGEWESYGKKTVEEFLIEVGINDINLPKTNEEFTLKLKVDINTDIMKAYLAKSDDTVENINNIMKKFGTEPMGTGTMREPGVSNFILKLKGDEITLFETLRIVFEKFKKSPVSYSEMTRVLFRNTFINVDNNATFKQMDRFALLTSFYIGGIYGFTAVESTLLLHRSIGEKTMPKISKDGIERLGRIYSDEILFNIYIKEIKNDLLNEGAGFSHFQIGSKNRGKNTRLLNISKNKLLDEKYRSSVINSVGFHSVFIGYFLLMMEWFWAQHKFPLLTTYLTATNETEYVFINSMMNQALDKFLAGFNLLFTVSKEYRDNPDKF